MSRAYAQAKFDDGTHFHCWYDGTVDVMRRTLFRSLPELEEAIDHNPTVQCTCGRSPEKVVIAVDYGSGSHWESTACRWCLVIVGRRTPYVPGDDGTCLLPEAGLPAWWLGRLGGGVETLVF